jgi:hypothetical protein
MKNKMQKQQNKHRHPAEHQSQQAPMTRAQIMDYRNQLKVSVQAYTRRAARLTELSKRPSAREFSFDKKSRNLRRLAAVQRHVSEAQKMIDQIDIELNK